jgi:hypothetical protein
MVRELDYVDIKRIKQLYNYNLVSMRERIEMENEANEEFHQGKIRPQDPVEQLIKRELENRFKFSGLQKHKTNKKLSSIYQT